MRVVVYVSVLLLLGLVGCGSSASVAEVAPTIAVPTPTRAPAAPTAAPAQTSLPPDLPIASSAPTQPLTPTFTRYRDPVGVFEIDVPVQWRVTAVPEGVGITALAYNATATLSLSFAWQAQTLEAAAITQLAQDTQQHMLRPYLARDVQAYATQQTEQRYVVHGTATLNGEPSTFEIVVEQTAGGTVMLETWLAPTPLWDDLETLFIQPMRRSLVIDDAAAQALR